MIRTRAGRAALIFSAAVIIPIVVLLARREATSVRARFSLWREVSVAYRQAGEEYLTMHGHYPPRLNGSDYYASLSSNIFAPVIPHVMESTPENVYEGPLIDPFRKAAMFPNEQRSKVRYTRFRNPDSEHLPWIRFYGYPVRYYRWADGNTAILLSNGPDEDVDLNAENLAKVQQRADVGAITYQLSQRSYDPTNGTVSDGDIFRVLTSSKPKHSSVRHLCIYGDISGAVVTTQPDVSKPTTHHSGGME